MVITSYGVELRSINAKDIEQIRLWRNQDFVRENMQFKGLLTKDQQERWFHSLDLKSNYFFIFSRDNKDLGLVYIKDIDLELGIGEAGVFIGLQEYLNSTIPVQAILTMMDYAFYDLGLQYLKAKINELNRPALNLNKSLGYKFSRKMDHQFSYYKVDCESYKVATKKFRKVLTPKS